MLKDQRSTRPLNLSRASRLSGSWSFPRIADESGGAQGCDFRVEFVVLVIMASGQVATVKSLIRCTASCRVG